MSTLSDLILGNYKTVSTRLGLTIEDGRIRGVVDGVALQMWFGAHATHIGAILVQPAPFEMSVATKGLIAKLGELFGAHSQGVGDEAFDKVFAVKATDPAKVAALFDQEARSALLKLAEDGYHPAVDAHLVHLRRFSQGGLADTEQKIEHDFHEAASIAKVLGRSFTQLQKPA